MLLDDLADIRKHFGTRLKAFRERCGLSQQALADDIGVARNTITTMERGLSWPEYENLTTLAARLSVGVEDFFSDVPVGPLPDVTPERALEVLREAVSSRRTPMPATEDGAARRRLSTPAGLRLLELIGALNDVELESLTRTLEFQLSPATTAELLDLGPDEDHGEERAQPRKRR